MAELMEHVRELAEEIGPRPVSTEEEHKASLYISEQLEEAGFEVKIDEFATSTGVRWPYAISFLLMIVSVVLSGLGKFFPVLSTTFYALGLLLLVLSLAVYFTERTGHPILSKLHVKGVSQNVVAKYVPSSVARERRRRKVIIVAHVDTVHAQLEAAPPLVKLMPKVKKNLIYVMIALAVLFIVRMLPIPWPDVVDFVLWILSLVVCLLLLFCIVCIVSYRFMPYVAGGNDNASSAAVMLDVAAKVLDPIERKRLFVQKDDEGEDDDDEGDFDDPEGSEVILSPASSVEFEAVMHSVEEAEEAGVVPEGAEIEYAQTQPEHEPEQDDQDEQEEGEEDVAKDEPAARPVAAAASAGVAAAAVASAAAAQTAQEPVAAVAAEALRSQAAAQPEPEYIDPSVPSWYVDAKRRAAKEAPAKKAADEVEGFRSRWADVPIQGGFVTAEPEPEPEPEPLPEPVDLALEQALAQGEPQAAAAAQPSESFFVDEGPAPTSWRSAYAPQPEEESWELGQIDEASPESEPLQQTAAPAAEQAAELVEEPVQASHDRVVVPFVISDDSLDEFEPGFDDPGFEEADQDDQPATDEAGQLPRAARKLVSLIPSIGDSVADDDHEPSQRTSSAKQSKPRRSAPTARTLGDSFEPTKATQERSDVAEALAQSRQSVAVDATYESTPQAGPVFDPFAPKGDPAADASLISPSASTAFPAVILPELSGSMPAVGADGAAAPGATSSFPSLTSSFPSLTGSFAPVSDNDFAMGFDDGYGSEEDFNSFSPAATSEIHIPESKLHNALDSVGGLFGKFGKGKKKRGSNDASDDPWNDTSQKDDDFGWKGGGYYDGELSSEAGKAARQRAAQIREEVVNMTESDMLDKEVWFVALGASGAGNMGMKNFLEIHGSELRGSLIINLEAVGAGEICFVDYEGASKVRRSDRRLQTLVRRSSKELTGKEMKAERLDWRDTDVTPVLAAGQRGMTIMGFDSCVPAAWHWTNDTAEVVEEEKLEYMVKLLLHMIQNA